MSAIHLCDACYTDLEHNKLQRCLPYSYRWRVAWAERLASREAPAAPALVEDVFLSTFLTSFVDITYNSEYVKAMGILLKNPTYALRLEGLLAQEVATRYALEYYSFWMKSVVRMLMAEPRVRSSVPDVEEDWLRVRDDAPIIAHTWKAVRRCGRIKGELIERTWHPDRVWDWCFDEEEKREIGTD